jgi:hypothetical protein
MNFDFLKNYELQLLLHMGFYIKGTHHVQIEFLYNCCANESIKFIKKSEKITYVLLILLHL